RADYRATVDASFDAKTSHGTVSMLALATFRKLPRERACVRITIVDRPGRVRYGSFRVLGGTGAAARLGARGTFSYVPGPAPATRVSGKATATLLPPRRLPRACAALGS